MSRSWRGWGITLPSIKQVSVIKKDAIGRFCTSNANITKDTYPTRRKKLYTLSKIYNLIKNKASYIELSHTHNNLS